MYEVQRINILSFAKITTILTSALYVFVGLLLAVLLSWFRTVAFGELFGAAPSLLSFLVIWVTGLVIVLPLSFLLGCFIALMYNLVASWWGGFRVDLAKVTELPSAQQEEKLRNAEVKAKRPEHHA